MTRKTKKLASGTVRVDPQDQDKAKEIVAAWKADKVGKISMADIFRAGLEVFESRLEGA